MQDPRLCGASVPDGEVLPGQFCLHQGDAALPEPWQRLTHGQWCLDHSPSLPVATLKSAADEPIGWLLGLAVHSRQGLVTDALRIDSVADIDDLVGRHLCILLQDARPRVMPDAAAVLAVVYSPRDARVASSPHALGLALERDRALADLLDIPNQDRFYPFGLTPFTNVQRLMPNHHLLLDSMTTERVWPGADDPPFGATASVLESVQRIAWRLRSSMRAVQSACVTQQAITAGRDSRVLLAAARDNRKAANLFVAELPHEVGCIDTAAAREICRRLGLPLRVIKAQPASAEELAQWQYRVGEAVAGGTWQAVRTNQQLRDRGVVITGLGGEVGRAFYWRKKDRPDMRPDPVDLLRRMRVPDCSRLRAAAAGWLASLPTGRRFDEWLDLLYLEQRLGAWGGLTHYGHVGLPIFVPFSDRRLFREMLSLPLEYRASEGMADDVIAQLWPRYCSCVQ